MAQQLTDLGQRRARPQHLRRRGVAQPVGVDQAEASPRAAAATIWVTPPVVRARWGALTRTKTVRSWLWPAGPGADRRPPRHRRPSASGSRSTWCPLPRTTIVPARQSMSSSRSAATSPARNRDGRAWSGPRNRGARSGATITGREEGCDLGRVQSLGQSGQSPPGDRRHRGRPATARSCPSTWRKPSSDRNAVTVSFAAPRDCCRRAGDHEGDHVGGGRGSRGPAREAVG